MASSNTISILIDAKDMASAKIGQAADNIRASTSKVNDSTRSIGDESEKASSKTSRFSDSLYSMGRMIEGVAVAVAVFKTGQAISTFVGDAFGTAAQLEQTNMAFQSLIGNAGEANKVFSQLIQYANQTPFESKDIVQAAQTLMGFGTAGQQTVDVVKQLGDVVSTSGGNMNQLALVTGQIFSQGKMRAQDMYQIINDGGAGVLKIMAKNVGGMKNLTDLFDKGGVPAQMYFDAVTQATAQGGFAFEGAQKQANTFNGRLSTLKDSVTQFGMKLIGVKIDPQLGYQIEPGGLFDRAKGIFDGATKGIDGLFLGITTLTKGINTAFGPSLQNLWDVITTKLAPALGNFWHKVIEPLVPVIGTVFVGAFQAVINILAILLGDFSGFVGWITDNKDFLAPVLGALAGLKTALMLSAAFDAAKVAFATFQLVTIPSAAASYSAFAALLSVPLVMPAIAIGAALAAIAAVWDAYNKMKAALEELKSAQNNAMQTDAQTKISLINMYNNSIDPAQKSRIKSTLHSWGVAGYASGGFTGRGAADDVAGVVHKGEYVVPKNEVDQSTGRPKSSGSGATVNVTQNIYNQVDYDRGIKEIGFRLRAA